MTPTITFDELMAAIEQASESDPGAGFTTRELMAASGKSERCVVELVRSGLRAGLLKATRKRIIDLAGRPQTVPAYELVK